MFGFVSKQKYQSLERQLKEERGSRWDSSNRLANLRANCFLTNEKGHRVQYYNASAEVRAKAEGRENGK